MSSSSNTTLSLLRLNGRGCRSSWAESPLKGAAVASFDQYTSTRSFRRSVFLFEKLQYPSIPRRLHEPFVHSGKNRKEVASYPVLAVIDLKFVAGPDLRAMTAKTFNFEKFYREDFQIAHFYNTIEQQMLPSQQAMMLEDALAFERLIIPEKRGKRSISSVTWDDPKKLEAMLRKAHFEITAMVLKLMDTDLFKEMTKWKDVLVDMRTKIAEQEQYGGNKRNMRPWLLYWDKQLYKALRIQYQWGIESLHVQIPTIQAQLVFKERRIQLRPPIEEIRAKYYHELKRFLTIPYKFRGVQDTEQVNKMFAKLGETNVARFYNLYEKAEQLFLKLSTIGINFEEWIVLEEIDLEALIEEKFTKAEDWENQIKALKGKGRDAEKLPSEVKLECIVVSTQPIRAAIDDMLQRLYDTLVWTLRYSTSVQVQVLSRFLTEAIAILSSRPQSMEDVAKVNQKHFEFANASRKMHNLLETVQEKNSLLRSIAGSGNEQLPHVIQDWEKFELMFDSHQLMIKDQVGYLRAEIKKKTKALSDESEKLVARWNHFKPKPERLGEDPKAMVEAVEVIKENRILFNDLWERIQTLRSECIELNMDEPLFPTLEVMNSDLENFEQVWLLYEQFSNDIAMLGREEWVVFRTKIYVFDELLMTWKERLRKLPPSGITVKIDKEIDNYMGSTAASSGLKCCRDEALTADHWAEIFRLLNLPKGITFKNLKFYDLLSAHLNISENAETLKNISSRARSETTIREAIQELELWAAQAEFSMTDYKCTDGRTLKIIKDWKDAINSVAICLRLLLFSSPIVVKDNRALLQSLKSSSYYAQFSEKTSVWETRLMNVEQYVEQMNEIQRKWVYLEPIFSRDSVPSETSRFARVDVEFRSILEEIVRDTRLVSLCSRNSLQYRLDQITEQLSRCHRALNSFLEEKRDAFPRFYFIGDDDLLEILGQSTNPNVIQTHLKKLFQGINKVVFNESNEVITAVMSADGEVVELKDCVKVLQNVEIPILLKFYFETVLKEWLQDLVDSVKTTLKALVLECLSETELALSRYPTQVLCLVEQIKFCHNCENCLGNQEKLNAYRRALDTDLNVYNRMQAKKKTYETKLKSLILDKIHQISIVDEILKVDANVINAWIWQKQLRFYRESKSGNVVVRQLSFEFAYTYEYQGNPSGIVRTPLTDKCYLNLTQAMGMGLGGNPYGPAGTGKTESVKALGGMFGRQVLVFNCDEGIDSKSMNRIFTGLVQCGAWGCLDEFNRLQKAVLSAVSTQIQAIQDAIRTQNGKCILNGKEVAVNVNSAIFITMNPVSKGYGGRQELPNNLKQLFRPVVMTAPDHQMIVEMLLYSKGFKDADQMAKKLTTVFRLSREMLSMQHHYDWGLRAVRAVLQSCDEVIMSSDVSSLARIVVHALSLNTQSKLTFADSIRFNALVRDIFPELGDQSSEISELYEILPKCIEEMKLEVLDSQVKKVVELYEQLRQRMGVVIIGPSGAGKSTIWKILHKTLEVSGRTITLFTFNPKSMPRKKLLGHMDSDTREWFDGVITSAIRLAVKDSSKLAWIVCDGDIDPEWIEALNSVLDDNKILTMPSGERIQIGKNVNFLFETDSLKSASPATISRMGVLYVSEEIVSTECLVNCWLKNNNQSTGDLSVWVKNHLYRLTVTILLL
ncbi:unnamed protein product [Enterobius vermicularis]|uniref:DHC_N2 domain-containing protein n=1 Tax=Enterobius vermicularis TaxID=51028 RepID=A0A0N4UYI7_ENTVE|nr:unnamed protein product [Enterobius vermicularis]